ncbi:unnamed protein product [Gordionus sp. m RMFG-2023]
MNIVGVNIFNIQNFILAFLFLDHRSYGFECQFPGENVCLTQITSEPIQLDTENKPDIFKPSIETNDIDGSRTKPRGDLQGLTKKIKNRKRKRDSQIRMMAIANNSIVGMSEKTFGGVSICEYSNSTGDNQLIYKTTTIKQCCIGFKRINGKCLAQDFKSTEEVFDELGEGVHQMRDLPESLHNFTLFVPLDTNGDGKETPDISSHLIPNQVFRKEVFGDLVYKTPDNVFYLTKDRVNCVKLNDANIFSANGVIHTVNSIVPTVQKTIIELLSDNKELSESLKYFISANLIGSLKGNSHTVTALTNEAISNLDKDLLDILDQNDKQATDFLKKLVANSLSCECNVYGFNVSKTIIATDGIIQIVNDKNIQTPSEYLSLDKILDQRDIPDIETFKRILLNTDYLSKVNHSRLLVLIPQDSVFEEYKKLGHDYENPENAIKFLKDHTIDLTSLLSLSGLEYHMEATLFQSLKSVQCANLPGLYQFSRGIYSIIDKPLIGKSFSDLDSALDYINTEFPKIDRFIELLKQSKPELLTQALTNHSIQLTVTAPRNDMLNIRLKKKAEIIKESIKSGFQCSVHRSFPFDAQNSEKYLLIGPNIIFQLRKQDMFHRFLPNFFLDLFY